MPRLKLTARNVKSIKLPTNGRADYWDTDPKGFGLRVSESGRKTWVVMCRLEGAYYCYKIGTHRVAWDIVYDTARKRSGIPVRITR